MNNETLNILHVVTSLDDGGLEKLVFMIINHLENSRIKHHAAVLLQNNTSFLESDFKNKGVLVTKYQFDNRYNKVKSLIQNVVQSFYLAKYIKKNNIYVIHSHDFFPAFSARASAIIAFFFYFYKAKKIIITLHNSFFWLKKSHHSINKILSHFTSNIVCVSKSVMDYSLEHDKINPHKYSIIFNGVDVEKYVPETKFNTIYRREFSINSHDLVIGNVGVLSVRKGQKYLIEAFSEMSKHRNNLKLLIFGSERVHEKEISEEIFHLIDHLCLNEKVQILQPRKDLDKIYNIFDIFIMPSITEGLSLSAIEAMLMKKICLFSDIPSFREMIIDNENGFLFKSTEVNSLYMKLEYIIDNYSSLGYIGERARIFALKKYNVQRMCKQYENLYLH